MTKEDLDRWAHNTVFCLGIAVFGGLLGLLVTGALIGIIETFEDSVKFWDAAIGVVHIIIILIGLLVPISVIESGWQKKEDDE